VILSALCDYYDLLEEDKDVEISPFGFEKVKVTYLAILSKEGILKDIISLKALNDNKVQSYIMPKRMKSSAIVASPVCDNFAYIFGVGGKKGERKIEKDKFETSKELHCDMFAKASSSEAQAMYKFFSSWDIECAWEDALILKHYSEKGEAFSGNIIFRLEGSEVFFHKVPEIVELWQQQLNLNEGEQNISQCSITGKITEIARLHTKLRGILGASTMGASLVCCNKDADESYGLKQSRNSAVSEEVVFKYATALQHMLDSKEQKVFVGDATTVFWAERQTKLHSNIFKVLFSNPEEDGENSGKEDMETREYVRSILSDGVKGIYNTAQLDGTTQFYILGLSPNAGRTSVRFFYKNSFETFCRKIKQHYKDCSMYGGEKGWRYLKIGSLLYATISASSKEKKINPLLGGVVTKAVLTGDRYPHILFSQTMVRIKAEATVTQARAAILKGYLVRKNRFMKKEEEIFMYLNEESTNAAYVLGRIFSILEMIQKNALGGGRKKLNKTIKDTFFSSACSNPALVFPKIIQLAQHHLAKIEGSDWEKKLGETIGLLEGESFPKILNMEDQGRFILGYYQQTQKNYEKNKKED